MKWLLIMRSKNIPINGSMFKEKAQDFAEQLNFRRFPCFRRMARKTEKLFL